MSRSKIAVSCQIALLLGSMAFSADMLCAAQDAHGSPGGDAAELWSFTFDSRSWRLGHEQATADVSIREYVLESETIEAWTELVTSMLLVGDITVQGMVERTEVALSQDCPSLQFGILEESPGDVLFEWSHEGCQGYPPQHEIKRIVQTSEGLSLLAYAAKRAEIPDETRDTWVSILRAATPPAESTSPTAAPSDASADVPGVSLVNRAEQLRLDALEDLASLAKQKYECESMRVLDTAHERVDGEILINAQGQLVSGIVGERWEVELCGTRRSFDVVFRPEGTGESRIAFSETDQEIDR